MALESQSPAGVGTVRSDDHEEPLLTAPFVRLALADLAYFTAAGVAIYALPLYVTGPVGSNEAGAGLAFGAFAVSALVLRPFAGRLADRYGRRPLMVGGALLCALAMLLTAAVSSLALVVVFRIVLGVAEAAFFVASLAALADLAPPSRMGEALSYNSLGLYLGLTAGPPLGELLVEGISLTAAWYGGAGLCVLAAVWAVWIGETRAPTRDADEPVRLIHWKAIAPGLGFFASIAAMGGFLAFSSLHAENVGLARTSLPLAAYGIVVVIGRIAFAKTADRFPALPLGAGALATVGAGLTVSALWTEPLGAVLGAAVLALGVTFSTPAFFRAIFATARPSERGAASGTASAFLDLGIGAGPILLGFVAQSAGVPWAFAAGAGIAFAGGVWTLMLSRRPVEAAARRADRQRT
jgi:predicted MFS family arabinose efflux permease